SLLPLGELGTILLLGLVGVSLDLLPAVHERLVFRIRFEQISAYPRLAGRPAPGVVDQTDGDTQRLVELPAEKVADGGELADRRWRADLPLSVEVALWLLRTHLRNGDKPDLGIVRRLRFKVRVIGLRDRPLHVRLAGAEPDFADEHVVESHGVLAGDRHRIRPAGGERIESDGPLAVRTSLRG